MKRFTVLLILLTFWVSSCKKDNSLRNKPLQDIVFQGKYLGEGCWSVIQVIKPSLTTIEIDPSATQWIGALSSGHDTLYHNTVGAGVIPEMYRNGDTFYFTVSKIDSNLHYLTNCSPTKYVFTIKTISFDESDNKSK